MRRRPGLHRGPVPDAARAGRASTPRDPKPGLDLSPLARGELDGLDREGVLLEFVAEMRPGLPFHEETWRGFRTRRYKYTVLGDAHGGKPWQFFDLDEDPYELTNLVDDPTVRRRGRAATTSCCATGWSRPTTTTCSPPRSACRA